MSINAEVKSSVNMFLSEIKKLSKEFDNVLKGLKGFKLSLYYKTQYSPMNHFNWNFIPGYPKDTTKISSIQILEDITSFENKWQDFRANVLFEMETGKQRHRSGRLFNIKELHYSKTNNPKPIFAIRFEKRYTTELIANLNENIVSFFADEILKIKDFIKSIIVQV